MITPPRRVALRALALAVGCTAVLLGVALALLPGLDLDPAQPFADLLGQGASIVLLGCAAWAWLVTVVVLLEVLLTRAPVGDTVRLPARRHGIPAGYRRLVLGACGVVLAAGASAPALATPGPVHLDPRPATAAPATTPAAPVVHARAPLHLQPPVHQALAEAVAADIRVRPGDSLWRLAAERLPHDASDATIAHTWHRLYAANSDVVGTDPDHIEPGQRLAPPEGW